MGKIGERLSAADESSSFIESIFIPLWSGVKDGDRGEQAEKFHAKPAEARRHLRPEWHDEDDDEGTMKIVMSDSASAKLDSQKHIHNQKRQKSPEYREMLSRNLANWINEVFECYNDL